jgi:hypothetical protein
MRRIWLVLMAALAVAVLARANDRRPAAPCLPEGSPHRGWARARAPPHQLGSQARHPSANGGI